MVFGVGVGANPTPAWHQRFEFQAFEVEQEFREGRLGLAKGRLPRRIGRPQPRDRGADGAAENRARFLRLRAVLRKRGVEQGKIGRDPVETVLLGVVSAFRRSN